MNDSILRTLRLPFAALLVAALGLVPLWAPVVASAQEGSDSSEDAPRDELFIDTVDVNVVNVDVYVTDDEGKPVTGLTADDFEVLENGRKMQVSNFYAIEGSQVVDRLGGGADDETEAEAPDEELPPEVAEIEGLGEPEVPEDQQLSLVVYVDNYNIRPHNRRRVLQDVRAFLREHVDRRDRVMLVSYDRSLHVRRGFTRNVQEVVDALFELDELSGHAVHFDSDRRDVLNRIEEAESGGPAMLWAETYAESVRNDLFFSIDAMREIVSSLAGLQGRKALLYVSDGVPMIAGEDIFHAVHQKFPHSGAMTRVLEFDASRRFEELAAHANANRVSFYTIDAAGLRVSSASDVSDFGRGQAGSLQFVDSVRTHNLQSPLQLLAEKTGGRAIINTNRVLPDLGRVAQDFRTYYSLGYAPGHSGDGRYYTIEVELTDEAKQRGYSIRHRTGYRDKTSSAQMNEGVLAALNFPYYANPLDLKVSFEPGRERDDGLHLVPVTVKVPLRSLTLVPRGDVYEAKARLYLAAKDERGGISDVQNTTLPVQLTQDEIDQIEGQSFVYQVTLLLRKGPQKVAVGLRDEIAANNSFVTGTVYVN
jgi:VWFA-related protein